MAKIKRLTIPSIDKDKSQLELSYIADEGEDWYKHFGKLAISTIADRSLLSALVHLFTPASQNVLCI